MNKSDSSICIPKFPVEQFYGSCSNYTAPRSLCNNLNSIPILGTDELDNRTNEAPDVLPPKNNPPIYRMNDIYHREDERLKTFAQWPLAWLDKALLARTGMFYTGEDDKVKCYFCEVEIGRWEHQDEPVPEHMRWSPNCPLLRRRTTNNVPIDSEALNRALPQVSYDICGANEPTNCVPMTDANTHYFPDYPEYAVESARLRSFADWPRYLKQKPHQLAEAGFFYTGVGDRVKCFSCGGGLKDWDDDDEPWEQHALWLSKCRFLKLIKGQSYIVSVLLKYKSKSFPVEDIETTIKNVVSTNEQASAAAAVATSTNDATSKPPPPAMSNVAAVMTAETSTSKVLNNSMSIDDKTPANDGFDVCERKTAASSSSTIPEEKLCKICYVGEYNTAFLPCGHVVACAKCASSVTKCPLCRKPFTDVMRVYFS